MMPRLHSILLAGVLASATFFCPVSDAQEPATATPVAATVQDELRALRVAIELQSKQIDALTDKIVRLQLQLETRAVANGATAGAVAGSPAPASTPTPTPGTEGEFAAPPAKVVPAGPPPNVHIVVKGDSLEKIAKTHGTTVADLLKLNKITDPKKMQIGQQITLPPTATPPPAPASTPEKKEVK